MPRPLKPPTRDEIDEADRELFDRAVAYWAPMSESVGDSGSLENVNPWVGSLLWAPEFALNRADVSKMVRTAGERDNTYSHTDREFVDMVLAPYISTNVVQETHIPDAIAVGVRPAAIRALYAGRDEDLTEDELLLARYIRQVTDGNVDDATFDAITARMGTRGIVEYTYFITVLWMTLRQFQAFGLPDPSNEAMLALVDECESGARGEANWRERIRG